jgi:predicted Fe-Mo cluster-binding NifX family protein
MKLAITSKGPDLNSQVDPRFGRAPYIIVVDTETMSHRALDNRQNMDAFKGAGIKTATMIHDEGVEILLTGYCGPKAFQTLQAAGIRVVSDIDGDVAAAIERYKAGDLAFTARPNAEAHW